MDTKSRYTSIQTKLSKIGDSGCNFLCLLSIAEEVNNKEVDLICAVNDCMANGWLDEDYYVKDNLAVLKYLTGKTWTRSDYTAVPATIKDNEYTIVIYHNDRTGYSHYKRRGFDTLTNSVTVAEGYLQKCYVYAHN